MGFSMTPNNYYLVRRAHVCYADRYNYVNSFIKEYYQCVKKKYENQLT